MPEEISPVTKKWYTSKTIWVAAIGFFGALAQEQFGWVISPEYQVMILGVLATVLRLITKEPVAW